MSFTKANNCLFGGFNFLIAIFCLPIIVLGILLASSRAPACARIVEWPLIICGTCVLLFSLIGLIGSCKRLPWLLTTYLLIMSILLLILLVFTIFVLVESRKGSGIKVPGTNFREYDLSKFSSWQRAHLTKARTWQNFKTCLSQTKLCVKLGAQYHDFTDFKKARLLPAESGCCKPPIACGFHFVNATYWIDPQNLHAEHDCEIWNNSSNQLCYDCDSCKAGVLENLNYSWFRASIPHIITVFCMLLLCCMGYVALRHAQKERHYSSKLYYA